MPATAWDAVISARSIRLRSVKRPGGKSRWPGARIRSRTSLTACSSIKRLIFPFMSAAVDEFPQMRPGPR